MMSALAACASNGNAPPVVDAAVDSGGGTIDSGTPTTDGGPDAALPLVGLCEECVLPAQCGATARCIATSSGQRVCAAVCNPDIPSCPRGFDCVLNFSAPDVTTCVPIGERCCIDEDADGYGRGAACLGPDCDDTVLERNPGADELCNGADDDCDDTIDEMANDCGTQRCVDVGMGAYQELPPDDCAAGECTMRGATSCALYTCAEGEDSGDFCATTCGVAGSDSDGFCVRTAHCDLGVCDPDVPNGNVCDEDTDCESGHCDNGFCCNDGTCCAVASDCPSVGGIGTTCDDSATCQGSRGEILCDMNQCGTRSGVPDDSACGTTVEANTCGFARSIFCTGAVNQPPPSCPGTCASDAACDANAHCDTVCVPDVPDGNPCDENSDCIGGYCDNNICCARGDCCRTPVDCPASYSTAATCDSPSTCQGTRDAATCASFVCGTNVDVADDSACTSSLEALMCGIYPSRFCSSGTDQTPPVCATACTADSECDSGAHCDSNACIPNIPNGMACDENSDCTSGHCQNGFCCATGDCCASASNCSAGTYGEPPVCNSATSCQGTRRDPTCNSSFQCQLGGSVDDDSACAGLLANTCGLYPSVFCTAMSAQPTDQMSLCAMMCTTSTDCDAGAFCMSGSCQPRGMAGDACTSTPQCESGLACVDGVCCSSSCTGNCRACNVPGSLGTCTNVPAGTDPDGECGGVSCASYYYGFVGDMCYRRADAPPSAVDCNGAGLCENAADVCPLQTQGTLQINCDDLCQAPSSSTCNGTTAGACNNITPSPPTQTCGTGACQVTANQCNAGTPVVCVPGTPSAEVCDDIDNNCNTSVDEGLSGDAYESNNSCAAANFRGTLYTQNMSGQPSSLTITPTIYGSGDIDVFRVNWSENDSSCGCGGIFATDEDYGLVATVTVPAGAGSYRICGSMGGTCATGSTCTTIAAGTSAAVTIWQDGCCSPIGCNDSGTGWFTINGQGAPAFECRPYTLEIRTVQGCR